MEVRGNKLPPPPITDVQQRFLSLGSRASYLDEGDSQRFLGHSPGDLVTDSVNELVGNDEH